MKMDKKIRVMIVDDHSVVRSGLGAFLMVVNDLELVAEASSGEEAIQKAAEIQPDVILMDEPTSALDEDTESVITDYIGKYLSSRSATLVMVTHSKQLAREIGRKVITFSRGKIVDIEEVA